MAAAALAAGLLPRSMIARQQAPSGTADDRSERGGFRGRHQLTNSSWRTSSTSSGRRRVVVLSVMSKPKEDETSAALTAPLRGEDAESEKMVYRDNWFDRLAIRYMSRSLQATTGLKNDKHGYDGFIEASRMVFRNFGPEEQRQMVMGSLDKAIPQFILAMIRVFLNNSKSAREYFAFFTTIFFAWLIGPSEVRESELQGRTEKNVVYIKKCRFLEGTNCVGMCTNLCKIPSQEFIKEKLGMPLTMVPNFEDMSCEMIFGQDPPSDADDPALKQQCYQICQMK